MSLLMQALKKAERNQRDALPDDDQPALPSEMYDSVLAPDDALSGMPPAQELSLEPLEFQYAADVPAGGDSEPVPVLRPATPAPHDPTPPQSRRKAEPKRKTPAPGKVHTARLELPPGDAPAAPPTSGHVEIQPDAAGLPPGAPAATNAPLSLMPLDAADTPPGQAALASAAAPPAEAGLAHDTLSATPFDTHTAHGGAEGNTHRTTRVATGVAGAGAVHAGLATDADADAPAGSMAPAEPGANAHDAQSANPGSAASGKLAATAHDVLSAYPGNLQPGSAAHAAPPANMHAQPSANPNSAPAGSAAPAEPGAYTHGQQPLNPDSVRSGGATPAEPAASAQGAQSANAVNGKPPIHGAAPGRGAGRSSAGAAARARAAAKAAAEQDRPGRDPARVRLAVLGGVLALVAGTLAGVYWYALTSPGPGAKLPPVPMPPPGAPAGPAAIMVAPPAAQPDSLAPPAPDASQAAAIAANAPHIVPQQPSPHGGSRMPSDDDLQRALQQPGPATAPAAAQTPASQLPRNEVPPGYVAPPNAAPVTPATPAPPATPPAATDIHVARSVTPQRVNPALQEGYQAFMAGDLAAAAQSYASALRQDPNNRDALLGSAAVAARRNDTAAATAGYLRLLELNPSDPDAQAGLLALRPGDSGQNELRLKELLRREPGSGPLEFALGNLYAQQGRWPDAQQAYFRAYTATPENADYAFNLAVGLDQLNQRKLALTYYQRALDLSRSAPAVFDRNTARRRADQITASLPPQAQPQAQPQTQPITQAVPAPGGASAPPAAKPPLPAAIAPPAPPPPPPDSAGAAGTASQAADGAPPGRAGNNGRQP